MIFAALVAELAETAQTEWKSFLFHSVALKSLSFHQ